MILPHGALGWSALCACGISWSYSLIFVVGKQNANWTAKDMSMVTIFSVKNRLQKRNKHNNMGNNKQ